MYTSPYKLLLYFLLFYFDLEWPSSDIQSSKWCDKDTRTRQCWQKTELSGVCPWLMAIPTHTHMGLKAILPGEPMLASFSSWLSISICSRAPCSLDTFSSDQAIIEEKETAEIEAGPYLGGAKGAAAPGPTVFRGPAILGMVNFVMCNLWNEAGFKYCNRNTY